MDFELVVAGLKTVAILAFGRCNAIVVLVVPIEGHGVTMITSNAVTYLVTVIVGLLPKIKARFAHRTYVMLGRSMLEKLRCRHVSMTAGCTMMIAFVMLFVVLQIDGELTARCTAQVLDLANPMLNQIGL